MNPILRNILAVIAGVVVGSFVNGVLIMLSPHIVAPPEGVDFTTTEGLKASMHLMQPKHYIMPFLAHAIGTLVGAYLAVKLAASKKMFIALIVGLLFFIAGTINIFMLPSPLWFNIVDLVGAYFPFAFLGGKLAGAGGK